MPVSVEEIEAFLSIAEFGGFTLAARKLGRTQPAISRRIDQLETALGAPLFERTGRTVALTAAGRAFRPFAEAALAAIGDGAVAAREAAASRGAEALSVAVVGTLADSHLVDALRAFEAAHPEASVALRTATSEEVSALVKRGEAQLGLRYFPDPELETIALGAERLHVIVPARHPVAARRLRDLGRLAGETWFAFPARRGQPASHGQLVRRTLIAAGIAEPRITVVDSLTAQKRLIEAGLGIALMPMASCREELRIGSLRRIAVDGLNARAPVVAVRRKAGHRSALAGEFLDYLKQFTPHLDG